MAGVRPALRAIMSGTPQAAIAGADGVAALGGPSISGITGGNAGQSIEMPEMASPLLEAANPFGGGESPDFGFGRSGGAMGPVEKLAGIFERDEEQATAVLKHWVRSG